MFARAGFQGESLWRELPTSHIGQAAHIQNSLRLSAFCSFKDFEAVITMNVICTYIN